MPWHITEIKNRSFTAKYGAVLTDIRHDPIDFCCVIEDAGSGVAYVQNAYGVGGRIPAKEDLRKKLIELGFTRVRWIRVVETELMPSKEKL